MKLRLNSVQLELSLATMGNHYEMINPISHGMSISQLPMGGRGAQKDLKYNLKLKIIINFSEFGQHFLVLDSHE